MHNRHVIHRWATPLVPLTTVGIYIRKQCKPRTQWCIHYPLLGSRGRWMAVGPRLDSSKLARPIERDHMYVGVYSEVRGHREGITSLTQVARLSRHPLPTGPILTIYWYRSQYASKTFIFKTECILFQHLSSNSNHDLIRSKSIQARTQCIHMSPFRNSSWHKAQHVAQDWWSLVKGTQRMETELSVTLPSTVLGGSSAL